MLYVALLDFTKIESINISNYDFTVAISVNITNFLYQTCLKLQSLCLCS